MNLHGIEILNDFRISHGVKSKVRGGSCDVTSNFLTQRSHFKGFPGQFHYPKDIDRMKTKQINVPQLIVPSTKRFNTN